MADRLLGEASRLMLFGEELEETGRKKEGKKSSASKEEKTKSESGAGARGTATYLRPEPWGCRAAPLRPETAQRADEAQTLRNREPLQRGRFKGASPPCGRFWSVCQQKAHHSGVVVVGFDGQAGDRAVDPLLLLAAVAEPDPDHLLFHGELLGDERYLLGVGLRVLEQAEAAVRKAGRHAQTGTRSSCTVLAWPCLYVGDQQNQQL